MRPLFSGPSKRGATLLEVVIATAVMAIVVGLGLAILISGSRYLRTNEQAIEAQRSGLALVTRFHQELQSTAQSTIASTSQGVVFASPFRDDGITEFDENSQQVLWQKWVCYQYDTATLKVTRYELPITPATAAPGAAPAMASFAGSLAAKLMASDISRFSLVQLTATPPLWRLDVTAGNMTDSSRYGIELQTQVSPRN